MKNMLDRVTDTQTAFNGLTSQILDLITSPYLMNYYNRYGPFNFVEKYGF